MSNTPKFKRLLKKVEAAYTEGGEQAAQLAFRDGCLKLGHLERLRNLYRVKDKLTSKAVFFVPNAPQDRYLKQKSGRDVILKTRQVGFTTLSCVRALDLALWEPNVSTGIMAHQQDVVKTIFDDLVKFTYQHFKKDWGHLYNPEQRSDSSTTLSFADDGLGRQLSSSMRVMFNFRGKTVNFLHVSEAAFINPKRLRGSLQSVPVNGEVILESTPNGRGGEFFRAWQSWNKHKSLAPYKGFFVPWFEFYPELPEDPRWELAEDFEFTTYEEQLLENPKITTAHIAWRRWCIETNCQGDSDTFENEYPSNDYDCFFTGEGTVFPKSTLKAQSKHCKPPTRTGFLLSEGPGRVTLHEDDKGVVAIWDEPEPSSTYVIGADPSGGVGKDRGAAYVKCQQNGKLVARLWGQFDPADFAAELFKLATFYNKAWICPEANNHGHVVIHALKQLHYGKIYRRKVLDEMTARPTTRLGFVTSNETKIVVTERLKGAAKSGKVVIQDDELITEMTSFVQISSESGRSVRREASAGEHDDLVMAAALTEEMDQQRPINVGKEDLDAKPTAYRGKIDETGFAC